MVYQLLNSGAISSILIHKPGSVRGVRLVSVVSTAPCEKAATNEEHTP
jgi:hypothetical protein